MYGEERGRGGAALSRRPAGRVSSRGCGRCADRGVRRVARETGARLRVSAGSCSSAASAMACRGTARTLASVFVDLTGRSCRRAAQRRRAPADRRRAARARSTPPAAARSRPRTAPSPHAAARASPRPRPAQPTTQSVASKRCPGAMVIRQESDDLAWRAVVSTLDVATAVDDDPNELCNRGCT